MLCSHLMYGWHFCCCDCPGMCGVSTWQQGGGTHCHGPWWELATAPPPGHQAAATTCQAVGSRCTCLPLVFEIAGADRMLGRSWALARAWLRRIAADEYRRSVRALEVPAGRAGSGPALPAQPLPPPAAPPQPLPPVCRSPLGVNPSCPCACVTRARQPPFCLIPNACRDKNARWADIDSTSWLFLAVALSALLACKPPNSTGQAALPQHGRAC